MYVGHKKKFEVGCNLSTSTLMVEALEKPMLLSWYSRWNLCQNKKENIMGTLAVYLQNTTNKQREMIDVCIICLGFFNYVPPLPYKEL